MENLSRRRRTKVTPSSVTATTLLLLSVVVAGACGSARRGTPFVEAETTDPRLLLGERVFAAHCHQCHPGGEAGLGPGINNKALPGWLIEFQVRNGLGAMPAFSDREIGDDEMNAMIRYLKYLRDLVPDRTALLRQSGAR